jgi:flagellar biosynthesis/type III secretory pathway protein FliH
VDRARDGVPHFLRYFTPSAVVEVCADPRVTAGGCVIETNAGNVDAQLETQLEVVLRQLEERLYGG